MHIRILWLLGITCTAVCTLHQDTDLKSKDQFPGPKSKKMSFWSVVDNWTVNDEFDIDSLHSWSWSVTTLRNFYFVWSSFSSYKQYRLPEIPQRNLYMISQFISITSMKTSLINRLKANYWSVRASLANVLFYFKTTSPRGWISGLSPGFALALVLVVRLCKVLIEIIWNIFIVG